MTDQSFRGFRGAGAASASGASYATVAVALVSVAFLGACSGAQNAGEGDEGCPVLSEGMSSGALESAMECYAADGSVESAMLCREGLAQAASMNAGAVGHAVGCVLAADDRTDGALIADVLHEISSDDDKVLAFAQALVPGFDRDLHANTFTIALSGTAQNALGEQIEAYDDDVRSLLVSLALGYGLDTLASYCGPWIRELADDDPSIGAYARQIDQQESLDETERWALAASGEWSPAEILDCYSQERTGCRGWEGESPLELLAHASDAELGDVVAPSEALDLLRNGDLDEEEARGVSTFLSEARYPNRDNYLNSLMNDMTNPNEALSTRQLLASAPNARMCAWPQVHSYLRRSTAADPDPEDPNSVWAMFLQGCMENFWTPAEYARALGAGSWLNAPMSMHTDLRQRLDAETDGWGCDQYVELAESAYEIREQVWMAGIAVVEVARVAGDSCTQNFTSRIGDIAADGDAHPEGRLAAVEWMLDNGDSSGCSEISDAMRWRNDTLRIGPSEWAEAQADTLRQRCP